ncbi:MAG: Gldg family protein, partial [Opitutales bacterium]
MVSLALGVNFLATLFFSWTDLAEPSRYSLSAETRKVLEKLEAPIDIIVTITENEDNPRLLKRFLHDLKFLLSSIEVESRFGKQVRIHYVNVFKHQDENKEIIKDYELKENNQVLVACEDRVLDLFRFNDQPIGNRNLGVQTNGSSRNTRIFEYLASIGWYNDWEEDTLGRPVPRLFLGEEMLLRAIRKVSHEPEDALKAYFLVGHGEMELTSWNETRGLSGMKSLLANLGVETGDFLLGSNKKVQEVPSDADLVVIASPQVRLSVEEARALKSYLSVRHGSVMLLLDPVRGMEDHGLSSLLRPWGLSCDDMRLVEPAVEKSNLGRYKTSPYNRKDPHPIVSYLAKHIAIWYFPQASRGRPVFTRARSEEEGEGVTVSNLLSSSPESWAEDEWRKPGIADNPTRRDAISNHPGPVPYAVAVERKVRSKHGINIPGGKLVVFGNSSIFCNLGLLQPGNQQLFYNTTHWMLDEEDFIGVPPKPLHRYKDDLKPEE